MLFLMFAILLCAAFRTTHFMIFETLSDVLDICSFVSDYLSFIRLFDAFLSRLRIFCVFSLFLRIPIEILLVLFCLIFSVTTCNSGGGTRGVRKMDLLHHGSGNGDG